MLNESILNPFTKTYSDQNYRYTTLLRHKGTLIALSMDSQRRVWYTILNLNGSSQANGAGTAPAQDKDAWLPNPLELIFPAEITEVGFGVAGNTLLPVFKNNSAAPEAAGTVLPAPDESNRNKYDYFRSTTARLSADAPFQALSDGQYVYIFRQAIGAGHPDQVLLGGKVPLVNATLLADRFLLAGNRLTPKMEVRFQRSRSKTTPASRKDSLGAKDLDGNFFVEPTQELKFAGNLESGRFSVLLLPTQVAGIQRWQIFAQNSRTGRMDCFNVERSAEGLFSTRGTPDLAAGNQGYAESAVQFEESDACILVQNGPVPGAKFTLEAWIKPVRRDNDIQPLALIGGEGTPEACRSKPQTAPSLWIDRQTRLRAGFGDGDTVWFEFSSRPLLNPEVWNHIAVSFDGDTLCFYADGKLRDKTTTGSLYLNGVLQTVPGPDGAPQPKPELFADRPLKFNPDGSPKRLPVSRFGHTEHSFCGTLDEVRIWQRARHQGELDAEKNRRLTGLEPDLAGYWRFDEAAGAIAFNDTGNDGAGTLQHCAWVASDAPVGEHSGLSRSSFYLPGRHFASGPASILYYQQTEASSGYDGKKKPLKQNGRVMLAVATNDGAGNSPNLLAVLDFGVSATGRLAQISDSVALQTLPVTSTSNASLNSLLDTIAGLQEQYRILDEDVSRFDPVLSKLGAALLEAPSLTPNIAADLADSTLSGLNDQLAALKTALIELKEAQIAQQPLDDAFNQAQVIVFQHIDYGGSGLVLSPGVHPLAPLGFYKVVSSLKISGPVEAVLVDEAGNRTGFFTGHTNWVGDDWNDRAVTVEITETAAHAALRQVVGIKQAALDRIRATLTQARNALQQERDAKFDQRNLVKGQLDAQHTQIVSGASALMPALSTDQPGLSICGGLLGFAWANSAPLLFDSATGSLALYFRGDDDQFFAAYYDTRTERARYELKAPSGLKALTCFARSTDADMDKIVIAVKDTGDDDDTCRLVITGAGIEETWQKVPRQPADLARVLNGEAAEHSFIASGALSADGSLLTLSNAGGLKRAVARGATVAVGDARYVVQQSAGAGATSLEVKKTVATQSVSTATFPVFFIGYDYYANAATTSITSDLYNGSLLVFAVADHPPATQPVGNQRVTGGTTLSCKWTADAPGTTLNFDGKKQRAEAGASAVAGFAAAGDLTLETWARPSRVTGNTRLVHHRSDTSAYTLGLEKHDLRSALEFDGTGDYIDLGKKNSLILAGTFTQEVWIHPNATDDAFHGLLGGGSDNLAEGWFRAPSVYVVEKTKIHAGFGDGVDWYSFTTPDPVLKPGDWNHLAITFDGAVYKLYVNGVQRFQQELPAGKTPFGNPVQFIGKMDNFFPGKIDDVRIWKRARSAEEILADMNRRLGGNETDLIGYWHFEGGAATDYARNRNNGLILGNPKIAVSPLSAFRMYAGVNDQMLRGQEIIPAGNWTHLAATFDQAYGLDFNSPYHYLDCGNDTTLDLNQDLSIEAFCLLRDLGRDQLILQRGDFTSADETQRVPYSLLLNADNRLVLTFENVDGKVISCVSTSAVTAGFHKIAATRFRQKKDESTTSGSTVTGLKVTEWFEIKLYVDGTDLNCQLYLDGKKQGDEGKTVKYESTQNTDDSFRKPAEIGSSRESLIVGKQVFAPGAALKGDGKREEGNVSVNAFGGAVSEIRIWNTARDRSVSADGKTVQVDSGPIGRELQGDEKGLVSWWRFQEGNGNRAFDSKSQNHAVINGARWVNTPDPNGSRLSVYVNGRRQQTTPVTHPLKATPDQFTLGALQGTGNQFGEHFQGELEELRIWLVTRTEEQIQDNLFRSLVERKNAGSQILVEEQESLLAYYTFDANPSGPSVLGDYSLRGNHLAVAESPSWLIGTAPVGNDTPLVRSALAGVKNLFNGLIGSTPAVQEYADLQYDGAGNLAGVFKRCYGYIAGGQWHLVTGYKVGDMAAEWIGQVQFAPELMGFIEGAPPVPGENLTTRSVEGIGDVDDYNECSTIELAEAEETTYTYASTRDKGFDMAVNFNIGLILGAEAEAGFGLVVETVDVENVLGLKASFEYAQGWLDQASTSVGRSLGQTTSMELRGRFSTPDEAQGPLGRRFIPDNVGQALVRSETADVFALRLKRNGALISYSMRPNPDIPKDWNIISFPINPAYVKQGSLDGKIGLQPDVDYPNALTYSTDSSYFKPIEAYALKNRINRAETDLKTYFEQYAAGALGRRTQETHFSDGDLAAGRMLDKLPQLQKRNIVNTYVWTADGGLFAETLQTMDSRSETVGGSYTFKGMAGIYADLTVALGGSGFKFAFDALFGGHLNLAVNKTQESRSSFALNVNLDKVERDIYERNQNLEVVFDQTDPLRPKPKKAPGKVDAYRFMSFYLEPESDHHEQFYAKIVDPVWLEQSDDPAAVALRSARQPGKKPPCWRVLHRVTYVSRVLPPLDLSAPPSLEKTLQTLDIDSNFELIKQLEPYVIDKLSTYPEFSAAVEDTLSRLLPELLPHKKEVKQYLSQYFNLAGSEDGDATDAFGQGTLQERVPNQPPIVNAGPDQIIGLDGAEVKTDLEGAAIDDQLDQTESLFSTWEQVGGPAGGVVFDDPHAAATRAMFTKRGRFELRLTASDGTLQSSDVLAVTVNERPVISAGLAGTSGHDPVIKPVHDVQRPDNIAISGKILDDGLGDPTLGTTVNWSKQSGIGTVVFADKNKLDTTVTFPGRGHYILKLTVGNGTFQTDREVMVSVAARVTSGIQALYTFEEKSGLTVKDVSGTGAPLDLQTADAQKISWQNEGGVRILAPALLAANGATGRLFDALKASNEITLEAWLKPAAAQVAGLARILTFSGGPAARNFTLAQNGGNFHLHLRTDTTNENASNKVLAGGTVSAGVSTHLVCTRDSNGQTRMFVNGVEVASRSIGGKFSNWAANFQLAIGNEVGTPDGADRAWLGDLHLVAIYARALTSAEVVQNFNFGADANLPPVVSAGDDAVVNWADFDWNAGPTQKKTIPLNGRITHDRAAIGSVQWIQVGGPTGGVKIQNNQSAQTQVKVTQKGRYVFRITADDGTLTTSDETVITVNCPPRVQVADSTRKLALTGGVVETVLAAELKDTGLGDPGAGNPVSVKWSRTSGPATLQIATPGAWQTQAGFTARGVYNLKMEADNGALSTAVSILITANQMPVISVVAPPIITLPADTLSLNGTVTDNGLGNPADALTLFWEKVSGPGTVAFKGTAGQQTAVFGAGGEYLLRFTAKNPDNPELTAVKEVKAVVNRAPVVDMGTVPAPLLLPGGQGNVSARLDATVSDDGLPDPPGVVTLKWSKAGGPANVTLTPDNLDYTEAKFVKKGKYILQLEAGDGAATTTGQVTVIVNTPPVVEAGPQQKVTATGSDIILTLKGTIPDTGLGDENAATPVTVKWEKKSGPDTLVFADANSAETTVKLSNKKGVYALQLSADNGFDTGSDPLFITVNQPASVDVSILGTDPVHPKKRILSTQILDDGLGDPQKDTLVLSWKKLTGPGTAQPTFITQPDNELQTTVTFPIGGQYVLELTVKNGSAHEVKKTVQVAVA